jgi:hypothetical protein
MDATSIRRATAADLTDIRRLITDAYPTTSSASPASGVYFSKAIC